MTGVQTCALPISGSTFHFREGSSRVRDITVDAKLLYGKKLLAENNSDAALQQFLSAVEPQITARREDRRSPQINYYIGLANEAKGNKKEAKSYFTLAADQQVENSDYILYYQGLSFQKLGKKDKATACFNALISEGDKRIKKGTEIDFFAKFGEREAENVQLSNAYMLKGLGYKGLGNTKAATENLQKAVELSASNLYAKVEME